MSVQTARFYHSRRLFSYPPPTLEVPNFRPNQPGGIHARCRVYPHEGGFNPVALQRVGLEAALNRPLVQHMGEPPLSTAYLAIGTLLHLPESLDTAGTVYTLHITPHQSELGIVARLYNSGSSLSVAHIAPALLRVEVPPGRVTTLLLTIRPS